MEIRNDEHGYVHAHCAPIEPWMRDPSLIDPDLHGRAPNAVELVIDELMLPSGDGDELVGIGLTHNVRAFEPPPHARPDFPAGACRGWGCTTAWYAR